MAMPKQVQKQVDQAEALARELGLDNTDEGAEPVSAEVVDITPAEEPAEQTEEPVVAEEAVAVAEVVETAAPEVSEPDFAKLEQQHNTLKGKYSAETQAMADQIASLNAQLQNMQTVVAQVQAAPPADEPQAAPVQSVISPAEVEDYGEELLDVMGRKALLALNPTLEQLNQRLQNLEQGVGGIQQKATMSDREKVYASLAENVVDWKDVNQSDEFKAWLSEADPYTGAQRGALLNQAFSENDAARVVNFFNGYLKEQTTVQPGVQKPSENATPQVETQQAAQIDLETLVSPGGAQEAAPASAQGDNAGRHFTPAEIAAFYSDVQKGRYRGKEAEKAAFEQSIVDAANTGRIR